MADGRRSATGGLASLAMCGALMVPLDSPDGWELLRFSRVPPNVVTFASTGLRIDVHQSAGPIVYPFAGPRTVRRVRAAGRVSARLTLLDPARQGQRGADDYGIRVGLVESGTRRLGTFERIGAPAWVKRLFALAPPGTGISQVQFLNVAEAAGQVGISRRHPLSALIHEQVVAAFDADGGFAIDHRLDRPTEALALWLSSDGDDTGSTFSVTLTRLELE